MDLPQNLQLRKRMFSQSKQYSAQPKKQELWNELTGFDCLFAEESQAEHAQRLQEHRQIRDGLERLDLRRAEATLVLNIVSSELIPAYNTLRTVCQAWTESQRSWETEMQRDETLANQMLQAFDQVPDIPENATLDHVSSSFRNWATKLKKKYQESRRQTVNSRRYFVMKTNRMSEKNYIHEYCRNAREQILTAIRDAELAQAQQNEMFQQFEEFAAANEAQVIMGD